MESFAPIKKDRGANIEKHKANCIFANYFSHVTVTFEVEIDIIWTKTYNDLDF